MQKYIFLSRFLLCSLVFIFCRFTPKISENRPETGITGEIIFKKYNCNSCHGKDGGGIADLRNAWQKYTDVQIKSYIKDPSLFNNKKMPPLEGIIGESDLNLLVQYVKELGKRMCQQKKKIN